MAVDDLHGVDEQSLRWLIYLWRRLEGLPVLIAASTRPPRREHAPLLAELTVDRVEVLCPGPLSQPDPAFVAACTAATAANPFVLRELLFVAERVPAQVQRAVLVRLGRPQWRRENR